MSVKYSEGDRLRLTNPESGVVLEGFASAKIRTYEDSDEWINVRLDGCVRPNMFNASEWNLEVIPAPLEDGFYYREDIDAIYRVREGKATYSYRGRAWRDSTVSAEFLRNELQGEAFVKLVPGVRADEADE